MVRPSRNPASNSVRTVSRLVRALYFVGGVVCLGIAGIGVVVPLLPTTPFVIVAAALFARSSPKMHQRLLDNRVFGPLIIAWNEGGRIPIRAKRLATVMIVAFGSFAIVFVAPRWWLRVLLVALFTAVLSWLWTRPS